MDYGDGLLVDPARCFRWIGERTELQLLARRSGADVCDFRHDWRLPSAWLRALGIVRYESTLLNSAPAATLFCVPEPQPQATTELCTHTRIATAVFVEPSLFINGIQPAPTTAEKNGHTVVPNLRFITR